MQINVTFLLQIINFCATYFFLEKIILRPLVADLQKRDEFKNFLVAGIEKKEEQLVCVQEQKTTDLLLFQDELKRKYKTPSFTPKDIPFVVNYQRDKEHINQVIDQGTELLVKEVSHAHK